MGSKLGRASVAVALLGATLVAWRAPGEPTLSASAAESPSDLVGMVPARLVDTRPGRTTIDGHNAATGPLGPNTTLTVTVTGRANIPTTGVGAVVINVTATEPTASSYLTVWPTSTPQPDASNLNFTPGQTIPNLVIAQVGTNGQININNYTGTTHLIIDVMGWYPTTNTAPPPTTSTTAPVTTTMPVSTTTSTTTSSSTTTTTAPTTTTTVLPTPSVPVALAAGSGDTCALLANGTVRCWGSNTYGQLGNGSVSANSLVPVAVTGITDAVAIASGPAHNCAIGLNGSVSCWGLNFAGQLGNGTTTDSSTPVPVSGLVNAIELSASQGNTCALRSDRTVVCWGWNFAGQLGNGSTTNSTTPVVVTGLANVTHVALDNYHACASLTDGTVQCWGSNTMGQIGDGTTTNALQPVAVAGLTGATRVAVGWTHSCAALSNGHAACWGSNNVGELGDGTANASSTPVAVAGLATIAAIDSASYVTCTVSTSFAVTCWGVPDNNDVALTGNSVSDADLVAVGTNHACALLKSQIVRCWGNNGNGQLGDGTTVIAYSPVTVTGL